MRHEGVPDRRLPYLASRRLKTPNPYLNAPKRVSVRRARFRLVHVVNHPIRYDSRDSQSSRDRIIDAVGSLVSAGCVVLIDAVGFVVGAPCVEDAWSSDASI